MYLESLPYTASDPFAQSALYALIVFFSAFASTPIAFARSSTVSPLNTVPFLTPSSSADLNSVHGSFTLNSGNDGWYPTAVSTFNSLEPPCSTFFTISSDIIEK